MFRCGCRCHPPSIKARSTRTRNWSKAAPSLPEPVDPSQFAIISAPIRALAIANGIVSIEGLRAVDASSLLRWRSEVVKCYLMPSHVNALACGRAEPFGARWGLRVTITFQYTGRD